MKGDGAPPPPVLFFALGAEGAKLAHWLARAGGDFPGAELAVHRSVDGMPGTRRFDAFKDALADVFPRARDIVCVMPAGVVVRALAPLAEHKLADPAVVAVDVGGRWAVSLLSGHEGGANALAVRVANACGAEPVVTTTTDAKRDLIVGVGCRRGAGAEAIVAAVDATLADAGLSRENVRLLATADAKRSELGLREAAARMARPLLFVAHDEINAHWRGAPSAAARHVGARAVAEPCALLAGRRTRLLIPKTIRDGVTVAVAREHCSWSD